MSEIRKHPLNAEGKYYVDQDSCLYHCCFDIAPENFKVDEDTYCAYVFKQPENPEEDTLCKEAMMCCPMAAIHDDGELTFMSKLLKIFLPTLCLIVFSFSAFAQTPQQMEQDLVKSLEEVSKHGTYAGNYDEEKLGKAQESFKNKLLKYTKNPATLKYSFAILQKQMKISTSPDGKFRVYSWDLEDGGTMHDFDAIYQYQGNDGKVYVKSASEGEEEGDYGSFAPKVYEVQTKTGNVYLVLTTAIGSSQDYAQSINAMKIVGSKLDDKFKIFKTNSGMTNSIGFAFNAFSVVDRKGGFILILFDSKTNILKIPVVVETEKYPNGEVTNRFINYKFNGTNFVKAN